MYITCVYFIRLDKQRKSLKFNIFYVFPSLLCIKVGWLYEFLLYLLISDCRHHFTLYIVSILISDVLNMKVFKKALSFTMKDILHCKL